MEVLCYRYWIVTHVLKKNSESVFAEVLENGCQWEKYKGGHLTCSQYLGKLALLRNNPFWINIMSG